MIDEMVRCKNLDKTDRIECLCQWVRKCPPQKGLAHWVDGRSAKETAKHWVHTIPDQFKNIVSEFDLEFRICSPEYISKFDRYCGNARNHDLLIIAENQTENFLISFESKADEPFGDTLFKVKNQAEKRFQKNPNSNGLIRIKDLRYALFERQSDELCNLRYQLLTAVAGTLSEAGVHNAKKAIFIVQTFISNKTNWDYYHRNQDDLNCFVNQLSNGSITEIHDGILAGPIRAPGDFEFIPNDVDLYIGKYSINV